MEVLESDNVNDGESSAGGCVLDGSIQRYLSEIPSLPKSDQRMSLSV
jgi:hypothetical protein